MNEYTVESLLSEGRKILTGAGIENPGLETEILLGFVLKLSRTRIILDRELVVEKENADKYFSLVQRKLSHEPTAYLLGEREFFGRPFKVNQHVLIPRPETEELVEWIIEYHKNIKNLLDLCCGSGCIGITIACETDIDNLCLSDISEDALRVAEENTNLIKKETSIKLFNGDLFEAVDFSEFDVIVVNPPYITPEEYEYLDLNVKNYEPRKALEVLSPGKFNQALADESYMHLKPGGYLYIETSPTLITSWPAILEKSGFLNIETRRDLSGKERFVRAQKT